MLQISKINKYLFFLSLKYILITFFYLSLVITFINLLELSRSLDQENQNIKNFVLLLLFKLPNLINEISPFAIIISITFLFRYLINNNELISLRNLGYSVIDVFKPIGFTIILISIILLFIFNPLSSIFEKEIEKITNNKLENFHSIKVTDSQMWIKNTTENANKLYINLQDIDLNKMEFKFIKVLSVNSSYVEKLITASNGYIIKNKLLLFNIKEYNFQTNTLKDRKELEINLNFNQNDIIRSISNYKFIPFFNYFEHIKNLRKFNILSQEISLYYTYEIIKPLLLLILGFVVMGFSGHFKRNENFFKIIFYSILIGLSIFLLKEIIFKITIEGIIPFYLSILIIIFIPFFIGLWGVLKVEKN